MKALGGATGGSVMLGPGLKDSRTRRNHIFLLYLKVVELESATDAVAMYVADVILFCKVWCQKQHICPADVKLIRGSAAGGGKASRSRSHF